MLKQFYNLPELAKSRLMLTMCMAIIAQLSLHSNFPDINKVITFSVCYIVMFTLPDYKPFVITTMLTKGLLILLTLAIIFDPKFAL
ncbi:hypothetical protein AB4254_11785 [Vibrio breoganii]